MRERERECGDKPRRIPSRPSPAEAPASRLPGGSETGRTTTPARSPDLDLLRLSYICRAEALLGGTPERSWVLSKIHRFFDSSPDPTTALQLSLSSIIDRARTGAAA